MPKDVGVAHEIFGFIRQLESSGLLWLAKWAPEQLTGNCISRDCAHTLEQKYLGKTSIFRQYDVIFCFALEYMKEL